MTSKGRSSDAATIVTLVSRSLAYFAINDEANGERERKERESGQGGPTPMRDCFSSVDHLKRHLVQRHDRVASASDGRQQARTRSLPTAVNNNTHHSLSLSVAQQSQTTRQWHHQHPVRNRAFVRICNNFVGPAVRQTTRSKRSSRPPTRSQDFTTLSVADMCPYAQTSARMRRRRTLPCRDGKGE